MGEKEEFFYERERSFNQQIEILKSKFNTISLYRIGLFVSFLIVALWCLNVKVLAPLLFTVVIFIIVFGLVVKKHNQIKRMIELCQKLLELNQEEVSRLNFKFNGIEDGAEFVDEKHSYSNDLDIFGRNSLFQLINRTGTSRGKQLLAEWLMKPTEKEEIAKRQKAVSELSPLLEWRQKIQAYGRSKSNKKEIEEAFFKWLSRDDLIRNRLLYRILPYLVIPFSSALIVCFFLELLSLSAFVFPLIITGYFLYKIRNYSKATFEMTQSGVRMLDSIENVVKLIEEEEFKHEYLSGLRSYLIPQNILASEKIKELRKIFNWLCQRENGMYIICNWIFLLDFIFLAKTEKWRAAYKNEISNWFDAIAEFEALNSIAAFVFAHDEYVFPNIVEKPFVIQSCNIGHPLIPTISRVNSDFSMKEKGTTCVITGSNMAGKSTFLRTIGINAVLAFAGAPVCADSLHISIFDIFTSMRTKDNLVENISSFYAELLRLKMLLEQVNEDKPTFYLLDEILKGTNSVDRHMGAESLILQLNNMNAFGLVSTHDLELGKLEKSNKKIRNYHFSSSIVGEEIVFDYKLREGICESTNASQLMAKIGIQINS